MSDEEKRNAEPVPYFIHEGMMQRMSDNNKRLLIALVVALSALLLNNVTWIVYEGVVNNNRQEVAYEETDP